MDVKTTAEQLYFTTVRIETTISTGRAFGTGFFFGYEKGEKKIPFIVTCRHVIMGAQSADLLFTPSSNGQPSLGEVIPVNMSGFEHSWFGHPDAAIDIAVMPLGPLEKYINSKTGRQIYHRLVSAEITPTRSHLDEFDAIEDVIFVGYPSGLFDKRNLLPIVRKGITATPISVDYEGKKAFLIDASVFPGSSGSPVFLYNSGIYYDKKRNAFVPGTRIFFLGVLTRQITRKEVGKFETLEIPSLQVKRLVTPQAIDIGWVFRSETVVETIEAVLNRFEPMQR